MRSIRRIAVVAAAVLLLATACEVDDDVDPVDPEEEPVDPDEPEPDEPEPEDPEALPDLSGESLEVTAAWTGTEQERFEQVLSAFEQETGAEVTYSSHGDEPGAVLGPRIEGDDPPDVTLLAMPGVVESFHADGALVPLDDEARSVVEEQFEQAWAELGTFDGELYGVYFKVANKSLMWFNTEVFEQVGIEPADTWEEMLEIGEQSAAFGIPPFSVAGADGWVLTDWFENVYLRTAGPDLYDQLNEREIPWTDDSVIEALELLGDLWGDDTLIIDNPLEISFPDSVARTFTDPPDAAMVFEGDFVAGVIEAETPATVTQEADLFDFPEIEGSGPAVVTAGDQAVLMVDSEAGHALMRYLASDTAAEIWAAEGGFLSANQQVDLDIYPDEATRRIAEALVETETVRFDLSDMQPPEFGATPGQGMWQILQDFLGDPTDPQATAERLEEEAEAAHG